MKIVVVGSGFTGAVSACAIKIQCPDHEVVMIDSDRESKNVGFGESAPPHMQALLFEAFAVPEHNRREWLVDFLTGTKSTVKFNLRWKNFHGYEDDGYFSGIPDMASYHAMFEPTHTKKQLTNDIVFPDHEAYKIHDLWYELYMQGRRSMKDFEADVNPLYWYSRNHSMVSHSSGAHESEKYFSLAPTMHVNSYTASDWIKKTYGHMLDEVIAGSVDQIVANEDGSVQKLILNNHREVTGDLYIDCTGFRRMFANQFGHELSPVNTKIKHDSCVVVANGYTENIDQEMQPYTDGIGMQYGWTFSIPLIDKKSFGYVFDSSFIDADQAVEELASLSDPATRVIDPLKLKWTPGAYKKTWNKNYVMMGLAAGFSDPFDANTITINFHQIKQVIAGITGKLPMEQAKIRYSLNTWQFFELVAERVELHFGLAPRDTSDYWKRNHIIAEEKNLKEKVFDVLNRPHHSLASHAAGKGKPYFAHLYLSESLYYGLDMSRRCRQSDPALLDFAEEYFKSFNRLNKMRSEIAPSMRKWYAHNNIDLDQYIKFKKS